MPDFRSRSWRLGNAIVGVPARCGVGPIHELTTRGRKTGTSHANPVVPVEHQGKYWIVAPYGPVSWVHNARASGRVSLRYGRTTSEYGVREASAQEAGPVLKRYVAVASKARSCFTASPDAPVADFAAEADRHPVFELVPIGDRVGSPTGPERKERMALSAAAAGTAVFAVIALVTWRRVARQACAETDSFRGAHGVRPH
jgi:deazaflavin-dependent oxidoreductase (nitroreductase family)